jgi:hypothetical protein
LKFFIERLLLVSPRLASELVLSAHFVIRREALSPLKVVVAFQRIKEMQGFVTWQCKISTLHHAWLLGMPRVSEAESDKGFAGQSLRSIEMPLRMLQGSAILPQLTQLTLGAL